MYGLVQFVMDGKEKMQDSNVHVRVGLF